MGYRDDIGALRTRLTNLEQEQSELRAKKLQLDSVAARLENIDRELEGLRERLERERRLPLLDRVHIASPCTASWGSMRGDLRVRHCGQCDKNVYNVAEMTREEAEDVIRTHEGEVCMRLYQREDGTILTADCPDGVKRRRRRRMAAGALLSAGAAFGAGAWASHQAGMAQVGETEAEVMDDGAGSAWVMGTASPSAEPAPVAGRIQVAPRPAVTPGATKPR